MPWSTRELADLAGTPVSTIRYYHRAGLLEMPERKSNGYKQYEVRHLVRVLRIRRLTELGMSLEQVAAIGDGDEPAATTLRILEDELQASIARLHVVREELSRILENSAPTDLPPGFSEVATHLTATDRAMLLIYSRVLEPERLNSLREMLSAPPTRAQTQFAELAEDADEAHRSRLAEELSDELEPIRAEHPWTREAGLGGKRSPEKIAFLLKEARESLYNTAQRDVLARVRAADARKGTAGS